VRLSDVVSHSGLALYAEVALVIFFVVFVVVLWRIFTPGRRSEYEAASRLPLDDDDPTLGGTRS
jgi:cbb3-type cytochrome oxidase subunit 3